MDIKKYFYIAISCLVLEVLCSLYLIISSYKSDPAGEAMGQGLGYIGLLMSIFLMVCLGISYSANIQWAVSTISILAALPILALVMYQVKDVVDKHATKMVDNKFEQGEGIFPKGTPTALAKAIAANDTGAMKTLISQGAQLNQSSNSGSTYLHYAIQLACKYGHALTPVYTLLQAGADPNLEAPLLEAFYASGEKSLQAMEYLLQYGADPNVEDMYQVPILHNGTDIAKLKMLVAYGANLNIESHYWTTKGYTPLMSFVNQESWEAMLFLIEHRADPNHQAADGSTLRSLMQKRRMIYESSASSIPTKFLVIEEKLGIQSNVSP
jgi:ankyrin repeat protein